MGLLDSCQELFKTSNLYEVLGVNKEATDAELRRSYYKKSLKVHPDRATEDPQATEKFQVLGKLYAVLSDKEQRAVYDEQGVVDEETDLLRQDRSWEDHWRNLFHKITVEDIKAFEKKYKCSDEERQDVIKIYVQHEGDMDLITQSVLCFTQEEEPRICGIIQAAIDSGEVPAFTAFTQESQKKKRARRKRADREHKELEELEKERGVDQGESLMVMLQQNQKAREQQFNNFLSDLETKYGKKSKKSSGGKRSKK